MCSVALFTVFFTTVVSAKEYTFSWAENNGLVEGYRLYYKEGGVASAPFEGITANEGSSPINIGNKTSFTISGLDGNEIYHFTLTAYVGDEESGFAQVITVSPEDIVTANSGADEGASEQASAVFPEDLLVGRLGDDEVDSQQGSTESSENSIDTNLGNDESDFTEVGVISPEDERLERVNLVLPIIVGFLLKAEL